MTREGIEFGFAGECVIADASGALFWPAAGVLAVADLHLEKGSAFARAGAFLPPYDSRRTLDRLAAALDRHSPQTVICLGDSFHDAEAGERMMPEDAERLARLTAACDWVWIAGNHDPSPLPAFGGLCREVAALGPFVFRHAAVAGVAPGEISGHFHPKALVHARGRVLSCRCFVTDGRRLILPAFGAYAGGLNVLDPAVSGLLGRDFVVYALRREAVHSVGRRSLVGEAEPQPSLF